MRWVRFLFHLDFISKKNKLQQKQNKVSIEESCIFEITLFNIFTITILQSVFGISSNLFNCVVHRAIRCTYQKLIIGFDFLLGDIYDNVYFPRASKNAILRRNN